MSNLLQSVLKFLSGLWKKYSSTHSTISVETPKEPQMQIDQLTSADRLEMTAFIARLRSLGNRPAYKKLVDDAQAVYVPMTTSSWTSLLDLINDGVHLGKPGHDLGHARRDFLDAVALATDPKVAQYQPVEIVAAIISGTTHDYATGFVDRYKDAETIAGHAEEGAFRVYKLLHGVLEENLLLLVCMSIASHTHYLKPLACKDGSTRDPWYYELFEEDGQKYGWSIVACRFADRLDTNGSTLLMRHLLANADASESGGQDLTGSTFYDINKASINIMVTPRKVMIEVAPDKKAPTALQHVFNFAGSNFGNSVYSQDDYLFPVMSRLMGYKVAQATNLGLPYTPSQLEVMSVRLGLINPKKDLRKLLSRVSRAPRFEEAWAVLDIAFSTLSAADMATWSYLTAYLEDSYDKWLMVLKATVVDSSSEYVKPLVPLLDGIIAEIS